ncbi:unnamed protein product [Caenorhabditis auriculariae]|uniref:Hexosyltransferase n=1 Tax=Caenorhabditis auriculariae TaxID=2777116 RepID=A0A8S1GUL5_9PELO|nr:unnamed protein product [Caenorhabditis auriculariae]
MPMTVRNGDIAPGKRTLRSRTTNKSKLGYSSSANCRRTNSKQEKLHKLAKWTLCSSSHISYRSPSTAFSKVEIYPDSDPKFFKEEQIFQRRQIDDLWLQKINAVRYFVIGVTKSQNMEVKNLFDDLLQCDAQCWIKLLGECREHPKLLIKIDDDVMVDKLGVEFLIERYLSQVEYSENDLGTYCQGMAYILSGDLLQHMRMNIPRLQFLWNAHQASPEYQFNAH